MGVCRLIINDHSNVLQNTLLEVGVRGTTFDVDADRLVYCNLDAQESFKLLDCDKIATRGCVSGR